MYDLVIKRGQVLDGSGEDARVADVAVQRRQNRRHVGDLG